MVKHRGYRSILGEHRSKPDREIKQVANCVPFSISVDIDERSGLETFPVHHNRSRHSLLFSFGVHHV